MVQNLRTMLSLTDEAQAISRRVDVAMQKASTTTIDRLYAAQRKAARVQADCAGSAAKRAAKRLEAIMADHHPW
jgi:hypothetical protein